ncbi:MAG: hypothetical protein IT380_23765 [Myxococcales bacterium]|nr:hypothetical protein [Myxococcales bacterium]
MTRWGLAVLAAAAGLTGCNCGQSTVECTDVTVSFVSPTNGAQVVSPFDVEIRAADSTGVAYKYDTATLTSDNFSANGVVSDATAHFNGVQLPGGPHELTATIVKDSCTRTAKIDVTVRTETCTTPAVTAVAFPQDTSNDGILSAAELPSGTNLQVRVTAECTTGVQVQIKRGATVVGGPAAFSNGVATVALPTLPDSDSATYDLTAELLQGGAPVGQPGAGSIRVERALPQCQNTTVAVQGPLQGGAGAMHPLLGTGVTTGVSAEFRLDGAQAMTSTPSMGMVSATWNVPKTGETTYAVELRCTDNFGNVATDTHMVRVDYLAPTVMITQPATNPDGGATQVTNSPVTVSVMTNAENGSQACAFRVQATTRTPAGCGMVNGGVATVPVDLPLDGAYTIEVEVTDLAGNLGTGSVGIAAVLAGCGLGFTRPPACPALITAAQVNNGVYSFQTQSNVSCSGQTVRLSMQTVSADGGVGAPTGVGTGTIAASGQANILGTVASGEYVYTAEVDNLGADAGVSRASCDVTVDLDGPVIQSPTVPTGQSYATINVAQDTQPGTPGAQRLLQFSARVPAGGRVDVCTTQAVDPDTMQQRSTSAACGPGWYVLQANVNSPASGFTFSEGQYSIKIVVVGGGTTVESLPVPLLVDVTRPCVRKVMSPWPQDTAAPMGALNLVELGTNAPRLQFQLDPACKDVDTTTLSATSPVVVRNIVSGLPTGSFNLAADASFASGTYTVNLTQGVASEQDYQFFVELTDLANNKNLYVGGATDPARHDVRIDKAAPTCDIVDPSASQTLLGQAQVPGGQFNVTVGTSSDVPMNGISVTLAGPTTTTRAITPAAPAYQASTAFNVTGTNNWTVSSTCTDVAGNPTAAMSRSLTIDLDAPTCAIVAPTNTMPYSVNQIQTTLNVTGAEGRMVTCTTNGTPLTPALLVSGGVATHLLTYPNGTQTVACSLTDAAGNAGSCSVLGVVVNSTACALNLTSTATTASGFWHNRTNTGNLTANTGTADVAVNTPDCGAMKTVTLQRMVPTMGAPTSTMTNAMGNASFAGVAVADGDRWEVRIDNGAGVLTTQSFRVGLVAPAASGVQLGLSPVTTGTNLFFVAATGNRNVETMTAGYFADTNAGTNGAQFDAAVNGVTGARKFGLDGTVQLVFKGAVVSSQAVTTEPQSFTFVGSTLPHNDSGAFEVRVLDTAGNSTSVLNNPTVIDVIAPGAPTVTQSLTNARAAQVTLQWAPTYDDGMTMSSGGHAGYDVRWTTSSVPGNNGMATSTDYFGSSSYQDTLSAWSASNINRVLDLPPLNTYFIGVRARDEVGNYSAFAAPTGLANNWTQVTLGPILGVSFGQSVVASASLNNDTVEDIVVSAPTAGGGGAVYVYYGNAGFPSQATCAAGCQQLVPSDATAGQFGSDLGVGGNLGDVASEGKSDLVVGQIWTGAGFGGRAVIFFGTTSAASVSTANSIELRGDGTNRIGSTARIIRDIDGDGLDELALAAPSFNSNQGRVFIFRGRTQAQWAAARTATDPTTMVPYIPVSASTANYVIDGPTPLLVANGNAFGQNRFGFTSVGDINSDTTPDVAIPMSRSTINRYRIFSGAALAASSGTMPMSAATFLLELSETVGTNSAVNSGLGATSVGGRDLVDSTAPDLVTSYNGAGGGGRVYVYSSPVAMGTGQPAPIATITGPLTFGFQVSAGQVNTADTRADLVVGQGLSTDNVGWVVYQRAGSAFDGTSGSLGTSPAFWVSRFDGNVISGSTNTSLGKSNGVADIDGNGQADVVLSDDRAGTVVIWR